MARAGNIPCQRLHRAGSSRTTKWLAVAGLIAAVTSPAAAFRIELKDVAPDRIERQRAEAIGQIPFPGTPNVAQFEQRLKDKGLAVGASMFIRVFKAESELEVWLQKGDRYELFATYPICHWSGTLGPKISEGDKQAPEGVYTVTWKQLHMVGRHPRSLNLGFPNLLDRQFQRTGSFILIHGGCGSVGCYAMTNPVIEEVFTLAQSAIKGGQEAIHVHAYPFRMTEAKLRAYALNEWYEFWRNLKDVHDQFETTRRVPKVVVCEGRYWVEPDGEVASQVPLAVCGVAPGAASPNSLMVNARSPIASSSSRTPVQLQSLLPLQSRPLPLNGQRVPSPALPLGALTPAGPSRSLALQPGNRAATLRLSNRSANLIPAGNRGGIASASASAPCQMTLPSCRKWLAQQQTMTAATRRFDIAQARPVAAPSTGAQAAPRRR